MRRKKLQSEGFVFVLCDWRVCEDFVVHLHNVQRMSAVIFNYRGVRDVRIFFSRRCFLNGFEKFCQFFYNIIIYSSASILWWSFSRITQFFRRLKGHFRLGMKRKSFKVELKDRQSDLKLFFFFNQHKNNLKMWSQNIENW